MADFARFGSGTVEMAAMLAGNGDRSGIAGFLVAQEKIIQDARIEDRRSGASKASVSGGAKAGGRQEIPASDPAVTGEASGAMRRMMNMLNNASRR